MRVLAIDTAGAHGGLALLEDGAVIGAVELHPPGSYAETILVELDRLLRRASLSSADLDLVVVSSGPGSFTGVRIGIAAAQGFAFGIGKPLVGVPSLEILAAWARIVTEGEGRSYAGVIDARRGEVYYAAYRSHGPDLEMCVAPGAARPEDLRRALEPVLQDTGQGPFVMCGDGVPVVASEMALWPEAPKTVFPPRGADSATLLATLGERRFGSEGAVPVLDPLYIRPADARKPAHPPAAPAGPDAAPSRSEVP